MRYAEDPRPSFSLEAVAKSHRETVSRAVIIQRSSAPPREKFSVPLSTFQGKSRLTDSTAGTHKFKNAPSSTGFNSIKPRQTNPQFFPSYHRNIISCWITYARHPNSLACLPDPSSFLHPCGMYCTSMYCYSVATARALPSPFHRIAPPPEGQNSGHPACPPPPPTVTYARIKLCYLYRSPRTAAFVPRGLITP